MAVVAVVAGSSTTASAEFLRELVIDDFSEVGDPSDYPLVSTSPVRDDNSWRDTVSFGVMEEGLAGVWEGNRFNFLRAGPAAEVSEILTYFSQVGHDPRGRMTVTSAPNTSARWVLVYNDRDFSRPPRRLDASIYTHLLIEYELSHAFNVGIAIGARVSDALPQGNGNSLLLELEAGSRQFLLPLEGISDPYVTVRGSGSGFQTVEIPPAELQSIDWFVLELRPFEMDTVPGGVTFTLDKIALVAVPEPGGLAAMAPGSLGLLRRRRRESA